MKRIFSVVSLLIFILSSGLIYAQTYTSVQDGPWNSTSTWDNGIPTAGNSTSIDIQHNVTIPSGYTAVVDEIIVRFGNTFTIASGGILDLQNSGNTDLTLEEDLENFTGGADLIVNGTFINNSTSQLSLGSGLSSTNFNSGSLYNHAINQGNIPSIGTTWDINSTCEITGVTSNAPVGLSQTFGNLVYNSPGTPSLLLFDLTSTTIYGDLRLSNTNSPNRVNLASSNGTITINGNFIIESTSRFLGSTNSTLTISVGGNFDNSSSSSSNIAGAGSTTLNIDGDFIHTAGTIVGNASSSVHFTTDLAPTTHGFTGGGSFSNINVTVESGSTLNLDASNPFTFRNLTNDGIINASAGNNNISGIFTNNGTFNNDGGTITFTGTASSVSGTIDFYNFSNTGTFTSPATLSVTGNFNNTGTFTAPTTLLVAGDFNNSGSFTQGTNTVEFNGAGTQNVSGTAIFYDINTSGTAAVEIEGDVYLQRYLTLGSGTNFDADGSTNNGVLTLLSTSETNSAGILAIPSDASFTGNITFERYIAESNEFTYLAFPVNGLTIADLQNSFPITGPFTGASSGGILNPSSPSFYYYDEPTAGDLNNGWVNYPTDNDGASVSSLRGYASYMRDLYSNPDMISVRGDINVGNPSAINLGVDFNSTIGGIDHDGWNLVVNPFPCAIDWNASSGWNKSGLDAAAYIWDGSSHDNTVGSWNGIIAPGQAFWVKANSSGASLTCTEEVKVANETTPFYRTNGVRYDRLIVELSNDQFSDETHISFKDEATDSFDHEIDAYKLSNSFFNISSSVDDELFLSVNNVPLSTCSKNMKLKVDNIQSGNYTLAFSNLEYFEFEVQITLIDHFLDSEVLITDGFTYDFDVTDNEASYGKERFELIFEQTGINKPTISIQENTLISDVEAVNQWYKNGEAIEGATNNTLEMNETGIYHLSSSPLGCQVNSDELVAFVSNSDQDFEGCDNSILLSPGNIGNGDYTLKLIDLVVDDSIYSKTLIDHFLSSEVEIGEEFNYEFSINSEEGSYLNRFEVKLENQTSLEITKEGFRLISNSSTGNQWFKNDVLIEGANEASYQVTESGQYHVEVTNKGCKKSSQKVAVEVEITGLEELIPIKIYPNPGTDIVNISVPEHLRGESIGLMFYDKLGKLILSKDFNEVNDNYSIEIENLPAGFYTLLIKVQDKTFNHKFVKN